MTETQSITSSDKLAINTVAIDGDAPETANPAPRQGRASLFKIGLFKIGLGVGFAALMVLVWIFPERAPDRIWQAVVFTAENLLFMAPIIAVSVIITASIHATGLSGAIGRAFGTNMMVTILAASFVGAVTPICGVGVLPIIAGLLAAGVPLAPIMAFWLSSPVTDPTMFAVTLGTLGPSFAIGKTVLAFAIGLAGGIATVALDRAGLFANPLKNNPAASCCPSETVLWKFWQEPERLSGFWDQAKSASILIAKWLTIAFLIESQIRHYVPPEMVAGLVGAESTYAVELAVLVGAPIYLDGYASLPMVRGFVELGMAPGAAMAFMLAGGLVSLYASVAVFALVRWPVFAAYMAFALIGAWASGHMYAATVGVF